METFYASSSREMSELQGIFARLLDHYSVIPLLYKQYMVTNDPVAG